MEGVEFPPEWDDDDVAAYKDTVSRILAGLDQVRSELRVSWNEITWKRMREIAERVAITFPDFTVQESVLVGTWLLASAKRQIAETEAAAAQALRDKE